MSKRDYGKFERRTDDFYPTPFLAALPLKPNLRASGTIKTFADPCAGRNGDHQLVKHMEKFGFKCVHGTDISTGHDVLELTYFGGADAIITNLPHSRPIMHKILEHLLGIAKVPIWSIVDYDWSATKQAGPYLPQCSDIVIIGRVQWIPGSRMTGYDNYAWYRFDANHTNGPRLHWHGKGVPQYQVSVERDCSRDRAAVAAPAILQIIEECARIPHETELRVSEYLRNDYADIAREIAAGREVGDGD
jgi:hypothetical protein